LAGIPWVDDVCIYGVEIPNADGRLIAFVIVLLILLFVEGVEWQLSV
jgi:hypothetical protein